MCVAFNTYSSVAKFDGSNNGTYIQVFRQAFIPTLFVACHTDGQTWQRPLTGVRGRGRPTRPTKYKCFSENSPRL